MIGWAVRRGDKAMRAHALVDLGVMIVTACGVSWNATEPWSFAPGVDATVEPRCGRCVELSRDGGTVDALGSRRSVPNNGQSSDGAVTSPASVGHAGSNPALDTKTVAWRPADGDWPTLADFARGAE